MTTRVACTVTAAMFVCITHAAEGRAQQTAITEIEDTPVSLVGCVMREIEYRKEVGADRGGFLGLGGGLGDEYVLVNASRDGAGANADCSDKSGEAFELTGSGEELVEPFLGRRVVLTGILKEADIDPATRRPTGGNTGASGELRLFEVNVETVRAYVPPAQPIAAVEPPPELPAAPEPPVAVATTGVAPEPAPAPQLPTTASPLGIAGLFGLLALAGAVGLRIVRGRTDGETDAIKD